MFKRGGIKFDLDAVIYQSYINKSVSFCLVGKCNRKFLHNIAIKVKHVWSHF